MPRPTDLIRQWLQYEHLERELSAEQRRLRSMMRDARVEILVQRTLPEAVWVQYRVAGRLYEAVYPTAMLHAEIAGRIPAARSGETV